MIPQNTNKFLSQAVWLLQSLGSLPGGRCLNYSCKQLALKAPTCADAQ